MVAVRQIGNQGRVGRLRGEDGLTARLFRNSPWRAREQYQRQRGRALEEGLLQGKFIVGSYR
jgi:hypothetical protein